MIASFKAPPKGKSIPEDTHNPTLAISRSKHPVSEEFLRKHSEVHQIFFFNSTPLFSSAEQDVSFVLEATPRQEARARDEDQLVSFFKKKKKKVPF